MEIDDVPVEQVLGLAHFDYNVERNEYTMSKDDSDIILTEPEVLRRSLGRT